MSDRWMPDWCGVTDWKHRRALESQAVRAFGECLSCSNQYNASDKDFDYAGVVRAQRRYDEAWQRAARAAGQTTPEAER